MAKFNPNQSNKSEVKYTDPTDAHYATKKDMVVKETDIPINMLLDIDSTSNAVIAKDSKGYYVTAKKFVSEGCLDPLRCYHRKAVTVSKIEKNDGPESYEINTEIGSWTA